MLGDSPKAGVAGSIPAGRTNSRKAFSGFTCSSSPRIAANCGPAFAIIGWTHWLVVGAFNALSGTPSAGFFDPSRA